ncbi:MAG: site-specific DNA-methyltransferase, partial [Selenomonadaceae bacterium]|nr:site-specific DNA-methyltransferase [Selenomonadaceae bacterium]
PYNTGSDSFGYNDSFNHSTWLVFMKNRLEIAKALLKIDGSIFIQCDDNEQAYLKVLCDEIFGRDNFVATVVWEKKYSPQNDAKWLSDSHDFILVFAKNKKRWRPNLLPRTDEMNARYKNPDNDPRGPWMPGDVSAKTYSATYDYPITTPSGRVVNPPIGYSWRFSPKRFKEMVADNRIWFGKEGNNVPTIKRFLSEVKQGLVSKTLWFRDDVGDNMEASRELKAFDFDEIFSTPKPERLLQRILQLATVEGDIVLDFFMGSATTAAVALKMRRQFIGVEQMNYIDTVSLPRLVKVLEGDPSGISKAVDWTGGGSFVYCSLARLNQKFVDEIERAADSSALENILESVLKAGYIDYRVEIDKLREIFPTLTVEEQKQCLMEILDKNMLYVNRYDIDDEEFAIADADKAFTQSFYGRGER